MFIFTKRFPVAHTRNHDHPQLGCITPTDDMVKDVSWFGHLGPHGGPEGLLQGSSVHRGDTGGTGRRASSV